MATESPLLHDGGQMTAAVDLSKNLNGPGSTGQFLAVNVTGGRQVNVITTAGSQVYGILQNTPTGSQAADVGIFGVTKAVAGGTFAAGVQLTTDASGRVVAKTSLTLQFCIGMSLESSAATGNVVTIFLNPFPVATIN